MTDIQLSILSTILGWVILTGVSIYAIPQFVTILRTKNTSGLSIPAFSFFILCTVGMLIWGIGNCCHSIEMKYPMFYVIMTLLPNVIVNILNTTINIITLIIKLRHVYLAKKLGIPEAKLPPILLKKSKKKGGK